MHLRQNFLFRPFPEVRDYETGAERLLMLSAATWPGDGADAISGYNVARELLGRARIPPATESLPSAPRAH